MAELKHTEDSSASGVFENCNNHIREKLVELLGKNARCPKEVSNCHDCPYWADDVGCYEDEATADMLIANGVTVQEWIPVTERLPEDGVQVLACTKHGRAFSAHCERGRFRVSGSVTVTHWMPLPQPPKGE